MSPKPSQTKVYRVLDALWVVIMLVLLLVAVQAFNLRNLCTYMGTDYRGYFTSAQIAVERGFASVYDHRIQSEYQSALSHPCAAESLQPMERVSMPYLPVFVLFFLPLRIPGFTAGYLFWISLNLLILVYYLLRFSRALGVQPRGFPLLQWVVCLPVIVNLYLGQMNIFLMLCLGEFTLALLRDQKTRSGLWLAGMLIKPHTLPLLLLGLLISRQWRVILGFLAGALIVTAGSVALAGLDGVRSSFTLAVEFAGPLIKTAPTMMNWRALALNLSTLIRDGLAWVIATAGMILVAVAVFYLWLRRNDLSVTGKIVLILATYAGTLTIAWHSHFYLLVPLIPLLVYLDSHRVLSQSVRSAWLLGPPVWFILVYLVDPSLSRNYFGLGMLALSLFLFAWAATWLVRDRKINESMFQT